MGTVIARGGRNKSADRIGPGLYRLDWDRFRFRFQVGSHRNRLLDLFMEYRAYQVDAARDARAAMAAKIQAACAPIEVWERGRLVKRLVPPLVDRLEVLGFRELAIDHDALARLTVDDFDRFARGAPLAKIRQTDTLDDLFEEANANADAISVFRPEPKPRPRPRPRPDFGAVLDSVVAPEIDFTAAHELLTKTGTELASFRKEARGAALMLETKRAAERAIRDRFDQKWGRFWKCDRCGARALYDEPCAFCGSIDISRRGYTPPPEST